MARIPGEEFRYTLMDFSKSSLSGPASMRLHGAHDDPNAGISSLTANDLTVLRRMR